MRKIHKALHITHRLLIANRRYTLTITYKYITPYSYYTLRVMGEPTIPETQQPCILHRSPSLSVMCPLELWGDDQHHHKPSTCHKLMAWWRAKDTVLSGASVSETFRLECGGRVAAS